MSDRIKVGVKVRPLIAREKADNAQIHWRVDTDETITQVDSVTGAPKGDPFVYDHVFAPASSNQEVFEALVRPIVEAAVRGFNGTIFAYGQTASGKTYTMMGDQFEPGVIPQAVNLIFNTIENTHGREFLLRVCYMEIYNERVNDLLTKNNKNLKVSEDATGNVFVKDLQETITSSSQMVMDLMKKGENLRKIGVTNMNERSSRSHSIFRVIIESRIAGSDANEAIQVSHLNLVDLAGSERAGATGCVGEQLKEGCAINKSLFTLGKVIAQLSEGGTQYVNFRDSKLTRILQSSLGGNALTAIICAVTPAALEETNSTLGFASRARNIKNTATVNEVLSDGALLKRYVKQIDRLTSKITTLEKEKVAENEHLQKENDLLQERISRLKAALLTSDFSESSARPDKIKKLRRRTWSAPNRNISRMSLAPVVGKFKSVSGLEDIQEEDRSGCFISNGEELDTSVFSTPLEEFEKALIKAERDKSMDGSDWFPPSETFEDSGIKASEEDMAHHPPVSYVQTRRQKINLQFPEVESTSETPPSKLRAKIMVVEKELDEMNEFTRLEKQIYDEELHAAKSDLIHATTQLSEVRKENEELKKRLKGHEETILLLQNERTDFDIQLDMTVAKYETRIKDLTSALEDARYELSLVPQTPQRRKCIGKLYAVEEEPTLEDLVSEVKCLKDENGELLKFQTFYEDAQKKITNLEKTILDLSTRDVVAQNSMEPDSLTEPNALEDDCKAAKDILCQTLSPVFSQNGSLSCIASEVALNLTHAREKVLELECLLKSTQGDLVKSNDNVSQAEEVIASVRKENNDLVKEMHIKEQLLAEVTLELQHEKSRQKIQHSPLRLQTNQTDVSNASSEHLVQMKEELNRLEGVNMNLVKDLSQAEEEIASVRKENNDLVKEIHSKEQLLAEVTLELQHETSRQKIQHSPLRSQMNQTDVSNATSEHLVQRKEELNRLEEVNTNLVKDLQAKDDLINDSAMEIRNLQEKVQILTSTLKSANEAEVKQNLHDAEKLLALENQVRELDEDLCSAKKVLTSSLGGHDQFENASLTCMLSALVSKVANFNELRDDLNKTKSSLVEVKETNQRLMEGIRRVEHEAETLCSENDELGENLDHKVKLLAESTMEVEHLKEASAQQVENSQRRQISSSSSEDYVQMREEVARLKDVNSKLVEDLKAKDDLISECTVQVENLKSLAREQKSVCESEAKTNLCDAEKVSALQDRVRELDEDLNTAKNLLCSSLDDKDMSLTCMLSALLSQIADARELVADLESTKSRNKELQEDNQRLAEKIIQAEDAVATLRKENCDLSKEVDIKDQLLSESAIELQHLKEVLTQQSETSQFNQITASEASNKEIANIKEELVRLEEINGNLIADLQSKEDLICKYAIEMENLRENVQTLTSKLQAKSEIMPNLCDFEKLSALEGLLKERDEDLNAAKNLLCRSFEDPERFGHESLTSMLSDFISQLPDARGMHSSLVDQQETSKSPKEPKIEIKLEESSHQEPLHDHHDVSHEESVAKVMDLQSQSERHVELENELLQIQALLKDALGETDINASVTAVVSEIICTLNSLKTKCEELEKYKEECHLQLEAEQKKNTESINLLNSELETLENSKSILMVELENKNILLRETERETRLLREKVRTSSNRPCTLGTDSSMTIDSFAEIMASCKHEVEQLLAEKEALQAELESKNSVLLETETEIKHLKGVGHELWRTLQDDAEGCKSCVELKENLSKEQTRCQDLEAEVKCAQNRLIAEVSAISERQDLQDLPLPELITELMNSVMKAQKHVASVLQAKIDFYYESLQACEEREASFMRSAQKLEKDLEEVSDRNERLTALLKNTEAYLGESETREKDYLSTFKKLRALLNVTEEDFSLDTLISVVESRVEEWQSYGNHDGSIALLADENQDLRSKLSQVEEQVLNMKKSIELSQENTLKLQKAFDLEVEKSKKLQDDVVIAKKCLKDSADEIEFKTVRIGTLEATLRQLEHNLQTQAEMLEKDYSLQLNEKVSKRDAELDALAKEVSQKADLIDCLRANAKELETKTIKLEEEITECGLKLNQLEADLKVKTETIERLNERVRDQELTSEAESTKLEEEYKMKLDNAMSKEKAIVDSLKSELQGNLVTIEKLQGTIAELRQTVVSQSKQISSKESLQTKASSLYNDLSEKKELVSKLEKEIDHCKACMEEKDNIIKTLQEVVQGLKNEKSGLEADVFRANADRDQAIKNLALKMKEGPQDEIQELKAELEFQKTRYDEAIKASRDLRMKNRKLQTDLSKAKTENEELEKSENDLMEQIRQLSRSRSSRVSDVNMKNARQTKADLEALKEAMSEKERELTTRSKEATNLTKLVQEKDQIIRDLHNQIEMCQKVCAEKSEKIAELDKECEDMLSWGKSVEQNHSDLANRLGGLLKDLADSKMKVFSAGVEKILLLKSFVQEVTGSVSKLSAEQIEMQLSSKEKAVNNAKARVEKLASKIQHSDNNFVDFDLLQTVCANVHTENELIHSLGEEVYSNLYVKIMEEKRRLPASRETCSGCEELRKWGIEMERMANTKGDRVDQLEGLLHNCKCSSLKKSKSDSSSCQCEILQSKLQTQRAELADRKAEIVKLKMLQEMKNKPLEDNIRQLENKLKLSEQKVVSLNAENRRMLNTLQEPTVCSVSQKKNATTQTYDSTNQIYHSQYWSGGPSGIVEESNRAVLENKCRQLEKEKETYKKLCISRKERNDALEKELKQFIKDKENQENQHHGYLTRSRRNN